MSGSVNLLRLWHGVFVCCRGLVGLWLVDREADGGFASLRRLDIQRPDFELWSVCLEQLIIEVKKALQLQFLLDFRLSLPS